MQSGSRKQNPLFEQEEVVAEIQAIASACIAIEDAREDQEDGCKTSIKGKPQEQ